MKGRVDEGERARSSRGDQHATVFAHLMKTVRRTLRDSSDSLRSSAYIDRV